MKEILLKPGIIKSLRPVVIQDRCSVLKRQPVAAEV